MTDLTPEMMTDLIAEARRNGRYTTAKDLEDIMAAWKRDRKRLEALEKAGEKLWPYVFGWMPERGRARQAAERFSDVLAAGLKEANDG